MIIYSKNIPNNNIVSTVSKEYHEDFTFDLKEEDHQTIAIKKENFDEDITTTIMLTVISKFKGINKDGIVVLTDIPKEDIDGFSEVIDILNIEYKELESVDFSNIEKYASHFSKLHGFGVHLHIPNWKEIIGGKSSEVKVIFDKVNGSIISTQVNVEGSALDNIYKLLDVDLVDMVYLPNELVMIVDDEGLLKSDNFIIQYDNRKDKRVPSLHLAGSVLFAKTHQGILVPFFNHIDDHLLDYISNFDISLFGITN